MIRPTFHIAEARAAAWVNSEEGRALLAKSADAARQRTPMTLSDAWQVALYYDHLSIRPWPAQLDIFGDVAQYKRRTPESPALHAAIVKLRRNKYRIEPRGRWAHLVNGTQMTHEEVIRLADTLPDRRDSA